MLKNAYLLAKIGADTAENERNVVANLPKICNYPTGPPGALADRGGGGRARTHLSLTEDQKDQFLAKFRQNVARFRLYRHRFLQANTRFAAFFRVNQII